jgi:O-methyltransferase
MPDPGGEPTAGGLYARPPESVALEECIFYHAMDIPGVRVGDGGWDLRGGEDDYLGRVELAGRRVLEIGPASGFLTFEMERRGAEVVAVELGPEGSWDIVPHATLDLEAVRTERRTALEQLRNGFWYAHRETGSRAQVHYGDVYALPDGLGRFDLALLGAVLLHTRDPLRILEGCARLADAIVVTDLSFPEIDGERLARLHPEPGSVQWDTWWDLTPGLIVRFLEILGYGEIEVSHHEQRLVVPEREYQVPMFTVVGRRAGG